MTAQEELDQALAELAKAEAELTAAKAELKIAESKYGPAPKVRNPKKMQRPVHRNKVLRSGCDYGGSAPVGTRVRTDMTPVVTKELDPTDRPNDYAYAGRECLLVHDVLAGINSSDSWQRCKCASCVEIRKGI